MRSEAETRAFIPRAMARLRAGDGIRIVGDLTFEVAGHEVPHETLVLACARFMNGLGPDTSGVEELATAAYELVSEIEGSEAARSTGMR